MTNYRKLKWLWNAICLVSMCLEIQSLFVGENCRAEDVDGICKVLSDCPHLLAEVRRSGSPMPANIRKKLNALNCGFQNDEPIICCSLQVNFNSAVIDTVTTKPVLKPIADEDNRTVNKVGVSEMGVSSITSRNKGPPDVTSHPNKNLLPFNCGLTDSDRIYGGVRTRLYEMPWIALIAYTSPRGLKLSCGGTIINEWYVLTAAHCVSFLGNRLKLAYVVVGEYDIRSDPDCERVEDHLDCAPQAQNMSIAEVIPHPGYSPQSLFDDIALIRLSKEVDLSQSIKPICLPTTPKLQLETLTGTKGLVAGWGATEDGLQSPVLLSVDLPVLSKEDCENAYKTKISDQQICAGGVQGKDSCAGDSGGPLMYNGNGSVSRRQIQRGIVSFGSKRCGLGGIPGVYTNIAYYMDWILDHMHE